MLKPIHSPSMLHHQGEPLPAEFGLLCWNIHKETLDPEFEPFFHRLLQSSPSNLLMFQEAKLSVHRSLHLPGFSYAMSTNIQTLRHLYGVMTAANASFETVKKVLTQTQEIRFATHKSLLMTTHLLSDESRLLVVNVHAINFVPLRWFLRELDYLQSVLEKEPGAMIVAGDFNNWTKKRRGYLDRFCKELDLTSANMNEAHHVKQLFRQPLDHIFYRGLTLVEAKAIDTGKISDHNPVYARFGLLTS